MKFFDSHCHLQFPQYEADLDAVLLRMQEQNIGAVVVGTDPSTSRAGVELARKYDFLWASVGLHPNDDVQEKYDISYYEQLAQDPKVVAIGECGLDYFRSGNTSAEKQAQHERFEAQIELARKLGKALIIHCRDPLRRAEGEASAHDDCSSILQKTGIAKGVPVVMHFFTGTADLAQKYLDIGCYLSFPGPITYTDMYDEAVRTTPMDKLLIETDAPFAAPAPYRGKRNEPSFVVEVARKIAALKELSVEEVGSKTAQNAKKVFSLQ